MPDLLRKLNLEACIEFVPRPRQWGIRITPPRWLPGSRPARRDRLRFSAPLTLRGPPWECRRKERYSRRELKAMDLRSRIASLHRLGFLVPSDLAAMSR